MSGPHIRRRDLVALPVSVDGRTPAIGCPALVQVRTVSGLTFSRLATSGAVKNSSENALNICKTRKKPSNVLVRGFYKFQVFFCADMSAVCPLRVIWLPQFGVILKHSFDSGKGQFLASPKPVFRLYPVFYKLSSVCC